MLVHSHFDLVNSPLALEATELASEPLNQMAPFKLSFQYRLNQEEKYRILITLLVIARPRFILIGQECLAFAIKSSSSLVSARDVSK